MTTLWTSLIAIQLALVLSCGTKTVPHPPPVPTTLAVAVVAQDQNGIGIPGAVVGLGSQTATANNDGFHYFLNVPICRADPSCRVNVHAEAPGFLPYDGVYFIAPGVPDFIVRLSPSAPPAAARPYPAEVGWLRAENKVFVTEDGQPWLWVGASSFRLFELYLAGQDITPNIDAAVSDGFNIVRVLGMYSCQKNPDGSCNRNTGIGWLVPGEHADYYAKLREFADLLASRGLRMEFTALADAQILMSSYDAELEHLRHVLNSLSESWNVMVEIANEPFKNLPGGAATADRLYDAIAGQRGRLLVSIGNYDVPDGSTTFKHGDYFTTHPERKDEWPRLSHDLMDVRDGFRWANGAGFQGVGVPVVADEPIGAAEVNQPGRRSSVASDYLHYAAGTGLFGAGATFHSDAGVYSEALGPNQHAAAQAFVFGLRWAPLRAQFAGYQRGGSDTGGPGVGNIPVMHDDSLELRTFCKNLGREYCVQIRTKRVNAQGRDGWRVVAEPRQGLVELER